VNVTKNNDASGNNVSYDLTCTGNHLKSRRVAITIMSTPF